MKVTIKTNKGRVLSYLFDKETLIDKINNDLLKKESLQVAASKYVINLAKRKIPKAIKNNNYTISFKNFT